VDTRLLEALGPYVAGFSRGRGKRWLAQSPERPLAKAIVQRRKTGFGLPMAEWLPELGARSAALHGAAAHTASPEAYLCQPGVPWARRWARYLAARWER
jgi:hypothetical protein